MSYIESNDLKDIWRTLNPDTRHYTWCAAKAQVQCRLDYFLVSQSLHGFVHNAEITPGVKRDHSQVQLSLTKGSKSTGRGFWKLNTSLLMDNDYVRLIKADIKETIEKNENLNHILLWDFLKCHIRGTTISFSCMKSKKKRKQERELLGEILSLEQSLAESPETEVQNLLSEKRKN